MASASNRPIKSRSKSGEPAAQLSTQSKKAHPVKYLHIALSDRSRLGEEGTFCMLGKEANGACCPSGAILTTELSITVISALLDQLPYADALRFVERRRDAHRTALQRDIVLSLPELRAQTGSSKFQAPIMDC
jgi:hypothetical protein